MSFADPLRRSQDPDLPLSIHLTKSRLAALRPASRDPRCGRGFGDRCCHGFHHASIERTRDDVVRAQFLIGHGAGDSVGGGDLHLFIDGRRTCVKRAAEDARERKDVIDLVRIVATAGRNDTDDVGNILRTDLRIRIGEGEHDGMRRHSPDVVDRDHAWRGDANEDISTDKAISQGSADPRGVRVDCNPLLHGVHVVSPAGMDCAAAVASDDVVHAARQQDLDDRDASSADAVDDDLQILKGASAETARVDQGTQDHYGSAMLVVMEDRYVEKFPKPFLDFEAPWCADVLEVDATERGGDAHDGFDDLVGVLGIEADWERVNAAELLEQHRLAFHDWHGCERAEVAKAQDGGSVTDHGNGIALDRKSEGTRWILGNGTDNAGDTWRVGHRQVVTGFQGRLRRDLNLPTKMHQESPVGHVHNRDAVDRLERLYDCLAVAVVPAVDGDIAGEDASLLPNNVDRANVPTSLTDRGGEASEHSGPVLDLAADDDAVACARSAHGWLRSTAYGRFGPRIISRDDRRLPAAIPVGQLHVSGR